MLKKQVRDHGVSTFDLENTQARQPGGVDLNTLIKRVKDNDKREKKNNVIFVSLAIASVVVTGVIISL